LIGRQQGDFGEEVFEALLQVIGASKRGCCKQFLFEVLSNGVARIKYLLTVSFLFFLLQREVAATSSFSDRRGLGEVRAGGLKGAVFEAVEEGIESADRGSFIRVEASDGSQTRTATKFFDKERDGGDRESRHKKKGAKKGGRIEGRATTRRSRVERGEVRGEGVEVNSQEDQRGFKPFGFEATRMALEPFGEFGR
jgi:hypothetical protein